MSHTLLTYDQVVAKGIRLTRCRLWQLEQEGKFPKRVRITTRRIGWIEAEIDSWIEKAIATRATVASPRARPAHAPEQMAIAA